MRVPLSPLVDRYGRRMERPVAPWAVDEAVKVWFRQWGRDARVEWHPVLCCFCVHVTRRESDPLWRLYREGKSDVPVESVMLRGPNGAFDLEQMGPSAVVQWLERHSLLSGRGEYSNPWQAAEEAMAANERREREIEEHAMDSLKETLHRRMSENGLTIQVPVLTQL